MADAENQTAEPTTTTQGVGDVGGLSDSAKEAQTHISNLNKRVEELRQRIEEVGEVSPELAAKMQGNFSAIQKGASDAGRGLDSMVSSKPLETVNTLSKSLNTMEIKAQAAAGGMVKSFLKSNKTISDSLKSIVAPGAALFGQAVITESLKKLDDQFGGVFTKMQRPMLEMEKRGMQMGMGLGRSFSDTVGYLDEFRLSLTATALDTNVMQEEVTKVTGALSVAFDPKDATRHLSSLSKATGNVRGDLNLTKAALLAGAATGMEHAKVAELMSRAHLEFGETIEGSATILGNISLAAQESGLSFTKVAGSVEKAANSLKMWGGTVGSVTPIYNAFSRALGEGRKGLAPELFEKYIGGIQQMGFEMKALVGLQAGSGGSGGAIGAGLEMEALMEQGPEGMAEMSGKLIDTIKQFGGGQMVTREEAIADPAMERNFILQRQLLKQMVGGSDAEATQMMGILKEIDDHGISSAGDSEKKLGELMGAGERVQDRSTDVLQRELIKQQQIQLNAGADIAAHLGPMIGKRLGKQVGAARRFTTGVAKSGGFDMKDIRSLVSGVAGDKATSTLMGNLGVTGKTARADVRQGAASAETDVMSVMGKLNTELGQLRQSTMAGAEGGIEGLNKGQRRRLERGNMRMEDARPIFESAIDELSEKINAMKQQGEDDELSTAQRTQMESFRQIRQSLESAVAGGGMVRGVPKLDAAAVKLMEPGGKAQDAGAPVEPVGDLATPGTKRTGAARGKKQKQTTDELPMPDLEAIPGTGAAEAAIMQVSAKEPLPVAPTQESIEATEQVRREKVELEIQKPDTIEQDIKLNIKSDKQTITIEIEEEVINTKVREVIMNNSSKS